MGFDARITYREVSIPSGATGLSAAIQLSPNLTVIGIRTPSAWVAAALGFHVADDDPGGTPSGYTVLTRGSDGAYEGLTSANIPTSAARWHSLDPSLSLILRDFKLFSHNGSGTATNQTATRTIQLAMRELL